MFLHSNIRFLRNYTRKSQAEFGKIFKKTRSNIDSYERGNANPDEATQKDIADHFNLSLETLVHRDLQSNPALLMAGPGKINNKDEVLKAKEELIKELKRQIKFLEDQNESLIKKLTPTKKTTNETKAKAK